MQFQDHIYNDYKILSQKEEQAKNRIKKRGNSKQPIQSKTQQISQNQQSQPNNFQEYEQTQQFRTVAALPANQYQVNQFLDDMKEDFQKLNKQQVTYDMVQTQTQVIKQNQEILSENQKQIATILKSSTESNKQNSVEQNKQQLQQLILPLQEQVPFLYILQIISKFQQLKVKFTEIQSKEKQYKNQMKQQDPSSIQNNLQQFQKDNQEFNLLAQNASDNIQNILPENSQVVSSMQHANLQAYTKILDTLKKQIQEYQDKAFKAQHELEEKYYELKQISEQEKEQTKYRDAVKQGINDQLSNINFTQQKKEFMERLGGEFDYEKFNDEIEELSSQYDDIYRGYKEKMLDYEIATPNIKIEQKMLSEYSSNTPSILESIKEQLGIKFPKFQAKKQQKQSQPAYTQQIQYNDPIAPPTSQKFNSKPSYVHERLYAHSKKESKQNAPASKPDEKQVSKTLRNVFAPPSQKQKPAKKQASPIKLELTTNKILNRKIQPSKAEEQKSVEYSDFIDDNLELQRSQDEQPKQQQEPSITDNSEMIELHYEQKKEVPVQFPKQSEIQRQIPPNQQSKSTNPQQSQPLQRIDIFPNHLRHLEEQQFLSETTFKADPNLDKKVQDFTLIGKNRVALNKFGVTKDEEYKDINGKFVQSLGYDFLKDNLENIIKQVQEEEKGDKQNTEEPQGSQPKFFDSKTQQQLQDMTNNNTNFEGAQKLVENFFNLLNNTLGQINSAIQQKNGPQQQPQSFQQEQQISQQPFIPQQQPQQQPEQFKSTFQQFQPYNLQSYMQNFTNQYPQMEPQNYQFMQPMTQIQPVQPSMANNLIQSLLKTGRLENNSQDNSINDFYESSMAESSISQSQTHDKILEESSNQVSRSEGQLSFPNFTKKQQIIANDSQISNQNSSIIQQNKSSDISNVSQGQIPLPKKNQQQQRFEPLTSGLLDEISQDNEEIYEEEINSEDQDSQYSEGQIDVSVGRKQRKIF